MDITFPEDSWGNSMERADQDFWDNFLESCNVCGTCKLFDYNTFACRYYDFHDEEYEHLIPIEKPWFFRCTWWKEGK